MKVVSVFLALGSLFCANTLHAATCPEGVKLLGIGTCTPNNDTLDMGKALLETGVTSPVKLENEAVRAYFQNLPSGKSIFLLLAKDPLTGDVKVIEHEVSTCTTELLTGASGETQYCEITADVTVGKDTLKADDLTAGTPREVGDVSIHVSEFKSAGKSVKVLDFTNPKAQASPKNATTKVTASENKNNLNSCTTDRFHLSLDDPQYDDFKARCDDADELCLTPAGQVIHMPELEEGRRLTVVLFHPVTAHAAFKVEAKFNRQVLMDLGDIYDLTGKNAGTWAGDVRANVKLTGAGQLEVVIKTIPTDKDKLLTDNGECSVTDTLTTELTYEVTGHYHFMLGIMPAYSGLFDRKYTLHASDDGVQRLYAQDRQQVDIALTLSAYPWGVSPDDFAALGFVLGTSLRSLGKRWYLGVAVSSPIGIGLTAGPALVLVPKVDKDFVEGQPLSGTSVPTHDTVVPTWFIGVDVQAELFRRAFSGLAD